MSDSERPDPTYIALASGPGSLSRAVQAALRRRSSPPTAAPPPPPKSATRRAVMATVKERVLVDSRVPSSANASPVYLRMLEELSHFITPSIARRALDECLAEEEVTAEHAIPYDLRAVLVDAMPRRLSKLLPSERVQSVLDALDLALVQMHASHDDPVTDVRLVAGVFGLESAPPAR